VKLLTHTDIHQADKAPRSRTDNWTETISAKLRQIAELAKKHDAFAVCAGDVFNFRSASKNSHALVKRTIEDYRQFPNCVPVAAGSHDFPYSDVARLDSQPLGVLEAAGVIKLVNYEAGQSVEIPCDGGKVRVIGFPDNNKWSLEKFAQIDEYDGFTVVLAHVFAGLDGGDFFGQKVFSYNDLKKFPVDIWVFGHWHIDQETEILEYEGQERVFINVGAISRGSYSYENIRRTPAVGLVEFGFTENGEKEIIKVEKIPLKVAPFEDVFDVEKHENIKRKDKEISEFVTELAKVKDEEDVVTSEEYIDKLNLEKEVRETIEFYMQKAAE